MTSSHRQPVAVIGATGQQGTRVIDALLRAEVDVRALVRDPGSPAARALQARAVEVVAADQETVGRWRRGWPASPACSS